jgi:uncharacterized OsmC-like protein
MVPRGYGSRVPQTNAREFTYAVGFERAGGISAEGHAPLEPGEEWTPEHFVLAGLWRCSLASLRFHAERAGIDLVASGSASGRVTRRDDDGRYAFVELECRFDVELEPAPPGDELGALLAKAERDCFVGASLTVEPAYRWRVNGTPAG